MQYLYSKSDQYYCFQQDYDPKHTSKSIMKSEDYMKILVKSLQLSGQNLDLGRRSNFQQDYDPKHTSDCCKF